MSVLNKPWVLVLYPVALGSAFLLYRWAKRQDYQNKHLDYRALAEGLRVQLFWHLSGLPDEAADHYLRKQRTELEWIRNAIRAWSVLAAPTCTVAQDWGWLLKEVVLEHWAEHQHRYFNSATDRDHKKLARHEDTANGFFVFGLLLAIAVVFLHSTFHDSSAYSYWHHWLIVIMGTAPAIAAAMGGYAEKMAFSAQAKRYHWMSALFKRASEQLRALLNEQKSSEAQRLILDLGKEALEENGDWVIIHRERTLEVPKG